MPVGNVMSIKYFVFFFGFRMPGITGSEAIESGSEKYEMVNFMINDLKLIKIFIIEIVAGVSIFGFYFLYAFV